MNKVSPEVAAKLAAKTEKRKKKVLKALAESKGIVSYACEAANISRKTFYEWKNADEKFAALVDEITEATLDRVEAKLLEAINDDNLTAIIFYLKTKGKKRGYVEQVDGNLNINQFEQLMKETDADEDEDDDEDLE